MKKLTALFIIALLAIFPFAACAPDTVPGEDISVSIVVPDGAPALAIAKLLAEGQKFNGYGVSYEIAVPSAGLEAPQIVGSRLISGTADIAILPTNTAATLYNNGVGIKVVGNSIWGNIFMIGKGEVISDVSTLAGKVVYNISENGTPDLVFKHILTENSVEYTSDYETDGNGLPIAVPGKVVLAYKVASELIPLIKQGKAEYGILGEPAVTNALGVIGGTAKVVLDLQAEWQDVTGLSTSYAQACLVVKTDFLAENAPFVDELISAMQASDEWIVETDTEDGGVNIEAVKAAMAEYASASLLNITLDTVIRSNVETIAIAECKASVTEYLSVIYAMNPASVGGSLPDDAFYRA